MVNIVYAKDKIANFFFTFFTRPTDSIFLLENNSKHKKVGMAYIVSLNPRATISLTLSSVLPCVGYRKGHAFVINSSQV